MSDPAGTQSTLGLQDVVARSPAQTPRGVLEDDGSLLVVDLPLSENPPRQI